MSNIPVFVSELFPGFQAAVVFARPLACRLREHLHCIVLSAALVTAFSACADKPPPPATHHDAFTEHWVGKTKAQAIGELGQPTQVSSLSTGESTLLWDYPKDHCSIALHTSKAGKVESGHNSCDGKRSDR